MHRIFKSNTAYERESVIDDIVSENYKKINNYISISLNIIVPILLLFVFKVNFITFLICFILFDISQVLLEYTSIGAYNSIKNISWLKQKKDYENKLQEMTPNQLEQLKNEMNESQSFFNEKMKLLNNKLDEYKALDMISTPNARKHDIAYVEEVIMKLKNYNNIDWIKKSMKDIIAVSERLLVLVKEDPDSVQAIVNTYNIYAEELLKIIIQYEDMDDEQKEKYQPKIKKLMNTFLTHLEEKETKIQSYKEHNIDFDIDFLTKKLQESDESLDEEGDD